MLEKNKKSNFGTKSASIERTRPILDLSRTVMADYFAFKTRPWDAITSLAAHIRERGVDLPYDLYDEVSENVWVHQSVYLSPTAKLTAPVIVCGGAKICHYSHIECSVIGSFSQISDFSVVKNSITFDKSKLCGHNELLSSILGYESVIGAGAIVPDCRLDELNVTFDMPEEMYVSGKSKLGAVICDGVSIGACSVINPGTVIDLGSRVYPLSSITGYIPPYSTVR
jgi:NDP-sugar pyrophosphorylase family protein